MTKIEMARVIYQAVHHLPFLPSRDHRDVRIIALRRLAAIERSYVTALRVLDRERVRREQEKVTA